MRNWSAQRIIVWKIAKQWSDTKMANFNHEILNTGKAQLVFSWKLKEKVAFQLKSVNTKKFGLIKLLSFWLLLKSDKQVAKQWSLGLLPIPALRASTKKLLKAQRDFWVVLIRAVWDYLINHPFHCNDSFHQFSCYFKFLWTFACYFWYLICKNKNKNNLYFHLSINK